MKINRNGKEIELTNEELIAASQEYERINMSEDIADEFEKLNIDIVPDERTIEKIADTTENILSKNDMYMQIYWDAIEFAIKTILYNRIDF